MSDANWRERYYQILVRRSDRLTRIETLVANWQRDPSVKSDDAMFRIMDMLAEKDDDK